VNPIFLCAVKIYAVINHSLRQGWTISRLQAEKSYHVPQAKEAGAASFDMERDRQDG
jgi:hypothetical protein